MHIWINKAAANYKAQKIGLAAAILVASVGAVVADERFPPIKTTALMNITATL
jgi:AMMECR1 domain-containing protein